MSAVDLDPLPVLADPTTSCPGYWRVLTDSERQTYDQAARSGAQMYPCAADTHCLHFARESGQPCPIHADKTRMKAL